MKTDKKEFTSDFFLTPAECNAQEEMPLQLLLSRIVEVATLAANSLGVGIAALEKDNRTWVLSRLTTEMKRYPRFNESYSITTWIEDFNKHFSERNFEIRCGDEVVGYARSIWSVIDFTKRVAVELTEFEYLREYLSQRVCPIEKQGRHRPLKEYSSETYTFRYSDIDFNRHVSSRRYIDLFLDTLPIKQYDNTIISRFEIAYMREALYNETVEIRTANQPMADDQDFSGECVFEMIHEETPLCRGKMVFKKLGFQKY